MGKHKSVEARRRQRRKQALKKRLKKKESRRIDGKQDSNQPRERSRCVEGVKDNPTAPLPDINSNDSPGSLELSLTPSTNALVAAVKDDSIDLWNDSNYYRESIDRICLMDLGPTLLKIDVKHWRNCSWREQKLCIITEKK